MIALTNKVYSWLMNIPSFEKISSAGQASSRSAKTMLAVPNPKRDERIKNATSRDKEFRNIPKGQAIVEEVLILNLSSNWEEKMADSDIVFKISSGPKPLDIFDLKMGPGMSLAPCSEALIMEEARCLSLILANVGINKDYSLVKGLLTGEMPAKVAIVMVGASSDEEYQDQIDSLKNFILSSKA